MRAFALVLAALCLTACGSTPPAPSPPPPTTPVTIEPPAPTGPLTVQILAINDLHGNLEAPKTGVKTEDGEVPAGGIARLVAHFDWWRFQNRRTVIVSAGDLIGASPLVSGLFHDEPTIEAMNLVGLDINGVGNHELDEGKAELLRMKNGGCHPDDGCQTGHDFAGADFTFLAANVIDEDTNAPLFPPYEIRTFEGVKVAFVGMTLEDTPSMLPPSVQGLDFKDEAETVNALVPQLAEMGAHAIVVMIHEGGFQSAGYDGCEGLSGPIVEVVKRFDRAVDLVVTGHTHQAYNCDVDGLRVTSAGSFGRMFTRAELTIDRNSHDVTKVTAQNVIVTHDVPPAPDVARLVTGYVNLAAPKAKKVIGQITTPLSRDTDDAGQSALGSLIADAQLAATEAQKNGGAQIAFMNSGGIRTDLPEAGEITYEALFAVQPFGNPLVTMTLTGAQILEILEAQFTGERPKILQVSRTLQYAWKEKAPPGKKIRRKSVRIKGKRLKPKATYRVTVNGYLGSRGLFAAGTNRTPGIIDLDALIDFVQNQSPIKPAKQNRIKKR